MVHHCSQWFLFFADSARNFFFLLCWLWWLGWLRRHRQFCFADVDGTVFLLRGHADDCLQRPLLLPALEPAPSQPEKVASLGGIVPCTEMRALQAELDVVASGFDAIFANRGVRGVAALELEDLPNGHVLTDALVNLLERVLLDLVLRDQLVVFLLGPLQPESLLCLLRLAHCSQP